MPYYMFIQEGPVSKAEFLCKIHVTDIFTTFYIRETMLLENIAK